MSVTVCNVIAHAIFMISEEFLAWRCIEFWTFYIDLLRHLYNTFALLWQKVKSDWKVYLLPPSDRGRKAHRQAVFPDRIGVEKEEKHLINEQLYLTQTVIHRLFITTDRNQLIGRQKVRFCLLYSRRCVVRQKYFSIISYLLLTRYRTYHIAWLDTNIRVEC